MFLLSGKSYLPLKRLLDIVGSCSALLVFSPLMLLVAHKVKKNLGSPVIFAQRRPGLSEKPFLNYKFRTMKDALDKNGRPYGWGLARYALLDQMLGPEVTRARYTDDPATSLDRLARAVPGFDPDQIRRLLV